MRYFVPLVAAFICWSCSDADDFTLVGQATIKDNEHIELLYRGGGATAPDIIWVQKTSNNQKTFIGKIKWYQDSYESKIWQVNDSIIKVRLTDTSTFKGQFRDFTLNLNNRIYPNDGSMFADSTR
jgi:hypothetical protein